MESTIKINGVNTWYSIEGSGEPLLMLHPGGVGVDARAFGSNVAGLSKDFKVVTPERRGHGRTPDFPGDYTYELMATDTAAFIEQVLGKKPVKVLGMSDGAVVALTLAKLRPDLIERLICVSGVYDNSGWWDAIQPDMELPQFLIDSYASISPDGKDHFPIVHEKLNKMHLQGPHYTAEDLKKIQCRTLVMSGDDDEMALEHTTAFYRMLPNAELCIVPGTSHGLMVEKPELCENIFKDFFLNDAVDTFAPIRRKKS